MNRDPLSTLCVRRLTQLLELSSLEDLKALEDCAYVAQNAELEDQCILKIEANYSLNNKSNKHNNQVKNLFKFVSRKETPNVFGQELSAAIVEFIIQLIEFLKINTSVEGLFRISGNKKRQEELKVIISKGGHVNLLIPSSPYSPHDVAGILKQFFGELPEPLLTKQLYDCYQQLAGKLKDMDSNSAKKRKLETMKYLFLLLPPLNRLLLKKLVELLAVVASDPSSKMTAYNLGVVFAPNFVCTQQLSPDSVSEFTENVEPFTDLVRFVIENADDVFQIPQEFLEEAKEYLLKIALDKERDAEVPMAKTFCQRIDHDEFRKEAKDKTHEALMLLYSQVIDMPDGPVKQDFLHKFEQSYPGTPLFIPDSFKEKSKMTASSDELRCPGTPKLHKLNINDDCSLTHRSASLPGLLTPKSLASASFVSNTEKVCNTPSTPGKRMKQCLKRLRRRSVEIFKSKPTKPQTPEPARKSSTLNRHGSSNSLRARASSLFKSHKADDHWHKSLKKSVSTPILHIRHTPVSLSHDQQDDVSKRKLSFCVDPDVDNSAGVRNYKGRPLSYTFGESQQAGFINLAFKDTPEQDSVASKIPAPAIRKALCPDTRLKTNTGKSGEEALPEEKDAIETLSTPKIMGRGNKENMKSVRKGFLLKSYMKGLTENKVSSRKRSNDTTVNSESERVSEPGKKSSPEYSNTLTDITNRTHSNAATGLNEHKRKPVMKELISYPLSRHEHEQSHDAEQQHPKSHVQGNKISHHSPKPFLLSPGTPLSFKCLSREFMKDDNVVYFASNSSILNLYTTGKY